MDQTGEAIKVLRGRLRGNRPNGREPHGPPGRDHFSNGLPPGWKNVLTVAGRMTPKPTTWKTSYPYASRPT